MGEQAFEKGETASRILRFSALVLLSRGVFSIRASLARYFTPSF